MTNANYEWVRTLFCERYTQPEIISVSLDVDGIGRDCLRLHVTEAADLREFPIRFKGLEVVVERGGKVVIHPE